MMYASLNLLVLMCVGMTSSTWKYGLCPASNDCECVESTLNCTDRGISHLPTFLTFTGVANITTLLLDHNYITRLQKHAFQGLEVIVINVSDNPLKVVSDRAFSDVEGLTSLVMDRCTLSGIPTALTKLRYEEALTFHIFLQLVIFYNANL